MRPPRSDFGLSALLLRHMKTILLLLTLLLLPPLEALHAAEPVSLSAEHAGIVNHQRRIFFETQRTSQRISYVLPSRNSRGSLFHTPFSPTVRMVRPASIFCSAVPDGDHVWGTRMDWRAACAEARAAGVHNPSAASKTKTGNLIGFLWIHVFRIQEYASQEGSGAEI